MYKLIQNTIRIRSDFLRGGYKASENVNFFNNNFKRNFTSAKITDEEDTTKSQLQEALNDIITKPIIWNRVGITRLVTDLNNGIAADLYVGSSEHNPEIYVYLGKTGISKEIGSIWLDNWTICNNSSIQ